MKRLIVWTGPMHSGKSTQALLMAERYRRLGHDVQLVRPSISVRLDYGDEPGMLRTKTGHKFPSIEVEHPSLILEATEGASVVWIDEAMLFVHHDDQVVPVVNELRSRATVLVSGLVATSDMTPFGEAMPHLVATADSVRWLKADCDRCGKVGRGTRTLCLVEKDGDVLVGGTSLYVAACPSCWTAAKAGLGD
jgi:thymidine kinase